MRPISWRMSLLLVAMGLVLGAAAPAQENVFRRALVADVKGFDPCNAADVYCCDVVANVFETLVQYSYLDRPCKVIPCLAEAMPQVSADLLTYTFKLRKGVMFTDDPCFKATAGKGRELTSADVIYSFKRICDSRNHSYGWPSFDKKVLGINDWHQGSADAKDNSIYDKAVEGFQAPDPYTVVIKLTEPYPQLLYNLCSPTLSVVPREAVEMYGQEFLNHPVGTGPYKVKEWTRNSKIIFERNPGWRGETYPTTGEPGDKEAGLLADAGKPIPFVDVLEMHIITEDQPTWLRLLKGELDQGGIPKDNFDAAIDAKTRELRQELADKGMRLFKSNEPDITLTAFNLEDPVLGKSNLLRQAMSLAYDNARRLELFYNNRAVPAQTPIPPGMFGYDEKRVNPFGKKDLAKAKELLAKAGYPDGQGLPEFVFEGMADTTSRQFGEMFQRDMAKLGIKIRCNGNTWPEFNAKMRSKRAQIFGYGSHASYPDPEDFLSLFYGPNEAPGPNAVNMKNAKYDELYRKMAIMSDGPERMKVIDELVQIIWDVTPAIWGFHRIGFRLVHGWVSNFKPHPFGYGFSKYYKVDPAMREAKKKDL